MSEFTSRYNSQQLNNLLPTVDRLSFGASMRCSKIKFCLDDLSIISYNEAKCDDLDNILVDPTSGSVTGVPWGAYDCEELLIVNGAKTVCCIDSRNLPELYKYYSEQQINFLAAGVYDNEFSQSKFCHTVYPTLPETFFKGFADPQVDNRSQTESVKAILTPNPVSDQLKIIAYSDESESLLLSLYNITGTIVWSGLIRSNNETHLDLSLLQPGVIFAILQDTQTKVTVFQTKIIKI
jgi:Secretion system C-terminal sorting domain